MEGLESTENHGALTPDVLGEMMVDVRRRLQARTASQGDKSGANPTTILPGHSLRETEDQLYRVFQLFDPRNTKSVPLSEVLMLLRAVAIDVDDSILAAIMNQAFSEQTRNGINAARRITCEQFVQLVKHAGAGSGSKQEARRVFEAVLPNSGSDSNAAISFEIFKEALHKADARITESELKEIFRYCALSGNKNGLTLKDFEQVSEFVSEVM